MRLRKRHISQEPETFHSIGPEMDEDAAPADWREPETESADAGVGAGNEPQTKTEEETSRRKRRGVRIGQFFTGGVLSHEEFTRRLPVFVYIVFLMLLYIANGFHIQHKHSELDRITDELKQLKTKSVTSSAVRMTLTRQSEIERLLKEHRIPLISDGTRTHKIEN